MQDIKPLLVFAAVLEHGSMNTAAQALTKGRVCSRCCARVLHRTSRQNFWRQDYSKEHTLRFGLSVHFETKVFFSMVDPL